MITKHQMFLNIWQFLLSDFCESEFLGSCTAKQNMHQSSNQSCWTTPLKQELSQTQGSFLVPSNIKVQAGLILGSKLLTQSTQFRIWTESTNPKHMSMLFAFNHILAWRRLPYYFWAGCWQYYTILPRTCIWKWNLGCASDLGGGSRAQGTLAVTSDHRCCPSLQLLVLRKPFHLEMSSVRWNNTKWLRCRCTQET